jgi:hypothetical protein
VTGTKEWYAVVFTARQAQAPESKKAAALLCVTVTASNEGKSERKGSHEASLWSSVCVDSVYQRRSIQAMCTCNC